MKACLNPYFTSVLIVSGVIGGLIWENYCTKPREVYYVDINGDNLRDIVIRNNDGIEKGSVFIQQHDGDYKSVEDHFAHLRGRTNLQIDSEKATIDQKLKELRYVEN